MKKTIEQTLNFIDDHLSEDITIEELAKDANYSVYYFQRMFSMITGYGIKEYIRERKLTRAAFDLINSEERIIDIAYKYGFGTPESFTKAFKACHGISPSSLRKDKCSFKATSNLLANNYERQELSMKVRIENKEELVIAGTKHIVSLENEQNLTEIPKLWNELNSKEEDVKLAAINDGSVKGIMGVCKKHDEHSIEYWIGTNTTAAHDGYETLKLEASSYAVFEAKGALPNSVQKAWKEIATVWIPTSGYEVDECVDIELYSDQDPFSDDCVTEIWIKLK